MVYYDKYKYEKIDFENVAFFFLLLIVLLIVDLHNRVLNFELASQSDSKVPAVEDSLFLENKCSYVIREFPVTQRCQNCTKRDKSRIFQVNLLVFTFLSSKFVSMLDEIYDVYV